MTNPDIPTRVRERVLKDIGNICCIYPTVGEAFWDEPRERLAGRVASWAAKLERYQAIMENCHGTILYSFDQLRDHFDDAGNLKGDGKWRLTEIRKCIQEIDAANAEAARLFNNPDEPVPEMSDDAGVSLVKWRDPEST